MNITIESSLPHVAEIAGLSPEAQQYLYARDDELQRRRASDYDTAERARRARTKKLEAKIERAIEDIAAPLRILHKAFWTNKIEQHFQGKGIPVPDRDVIKRVVDNFDVNRLRVLD